MKIVVDSNRIIASLLKDSTTREILYNDEFEFFAPEFVMEEIAKYRTEFINKGKITEDEFEALLPLLFERVALIPQGEYAKQLKKLEKAISDPKDIPYIACCLSTKSDGIWTHDPHFLEQNEIKVFTNKDLLNVTRT